MKYQYLNEPIPQESRQELNDKILYLVDQDWPNSLESPARISIMPIPETVDCMA